MVTGVQTCALPISARWTKGRITEEYLFWDSATFRSQIGLA
jgi:hypothetical protein